MAFMNTIQLLCRNITAIILLSFTAMFASCDNDDDNINEEPLPEEPQPVERTILAYIWGDIDGESGLVLSNSQLDYINKMEAGWDDSYAGSLYVYIDPSPMFVQFENPVLLKIKRDDTPAIVSEVVKEYEPIGTHGDIARYPEVQNDVRAIAPAKSYGLMLFGHGSGILPFGLNDDNTFRTKGMGGDAVKYLENREIADLTLPDYEFMIMHACMMASVEVAFELRHKTRYLVASEVSLSSVGWPWHENLSYLYTSPRADLSKFVLHSCEWLYNNSADDDKCATLSLIDASQLDKLAADTKKALMDSKITLADIQDAFINKCHLTENYFDDGKGEELFQENFPSAQLDFVDFMRKTGAFTDEWFSTYNKACLINTYGFGKDVKMYDEVDNHIEPYYNGLSIYPIMALENYSGFQLFQDYVNYAIRSYRLNQWYTACGFDLIDK